MKTSQRLMATCRAGGAFRSTVGTVLAGGAIMASGLPVAAQADDELITNGDFRGGESGWHVYPNSALVGGRQCVHVARNTEQYGAGLLQRVAVEKGQEYTLSYEISADPAKDADVRVVVQAGRDLDYAPFLTPRTQPLTSETQRAEHTFTARRDYSSAQVALQQDTVNDRAYQLCVDKVSLKPSRTPTQAADAIVQEGDRSMGPMPQADRPAAADSSTSPSRTPPGPVLAGLISLSGLGAVLLNRRAANTMSRDGSRERPGSTARLRR